MYIYIYIYYMLPTIMVNGASLIAKQRHTGLARQGLGHQGLSRTWQDGEGPLKTPGDAMEKIGDFMGI